MESLNTNPYNDPNANYEIPKNILCIAKEKYLPEKTVKFNKY